MDIRIILSGAETQAKRAVDSVTRSLDGLAASAKRAASSVRSQLNTAFGGFLKNQVVQAFSAHAIASYVGRTIEWGDALKGLSERLGITTRDLQVLQKVAERSNTSIEAIASAFRNLNVAKGQAGQGKGEAYDAFIAVGVTPDELKQKSAAELWSIIGARIGDATQDATKFAAVLRLLGKSADSVLPAMRQSISEIGDEMERTGRIVDEKVISELAQAKNQIDDFKTTMTTVGAPILGTMSAGIAGIAAYGKAFGGIVKGAYHSFAGDNEKADASFNAARQARDAYEEKYGVDQERVMQIAQGDAKLKAKRAAKESEAKATAEKEQEAAAAAAKEAEKNQQEKLARAASASPLGDMGGADALARIGLFRGGAGDTTSRMLSQQLGELKSIVTELRGIRMDGRIEE
jgi:hypothetical protein